MTNEELKHYGVLGMKWGRRKGDKTTKKTNNPKKVYSQEDRDKTLNSMLSNIGNSALSVVAGSYLVKSGYVEAGKMLSVIGGLGFAGGAIGDAHSYYKMRK